MLLALPAALLCQALKVPLPWMIGPLLITAACGVSGVPVAASPVLRNAGLWLIGVALGLYFTPQVVGLLLPMAGAVVAGVGWALLVGYGFYRFLQRTPGIDSTTAFFSSAIGGASEMTLLAERHQASVDRVAAAHSLRVLLVVVLVPVVMQVSGVHGSDVSAVVTRDIRPQGLLVLLLASGLGVLSLWRVGGPNPWVLGSLLTTAVLAGSGWELSALPKAATNAGQLFIGVGLGSRFTPDFGRAAPRWLMNVALGTLAMIAVSAVFGMLLSQISGQPAATLVLGTSPGGIAEMCITAKVLQLGVPVVTVFQLARYVSVLTLTVPLYRWEQRRLARRKTAA